MALTTALQMILFASLLASCSCIAGSNELESLAQGGDGQLVSYLLLRMVSGLETDIQDMKAEVELKAEVEDVQELKAQVTDVQDLKVQLELKARAADVQELKAQIPDMKELKAQVEDNGRYIAELKGQVADMQELKAQVADMQELKAKLEHDGKYIQDLKNQVAKLESENRDHQPRAVFAQMQLQLPGSSRTRAYKAGERVYFTTTISNVGYAYDTQHGYFEAPYDGTYLFTVTICTLYKSSVDFFIVKDGNNIDKARSAGDWTTCTSSTAVTQMKSGSRVWVETSNSGTVSSAYGIPSFTGVLLNNYKNPLNS